MNPPPPATPQTALTVGSLARYLQGLVEADPQLHQMWVLGEVSSVHNHPKGIFFTLQDPGEPGGQGDRSSGAIVHCVMWRWASPGASGSPGRPMATPQQGHQVIVLGSLRLYAARSQYQLTVWQWLPGGEGLQALHDRQLQARLEAEGLFDPSRKQAIPTHPRCVGVITAREGAAWGDIQRTLKNRYPGLRVLFAPAQVQGSQAPASLVQALQRLQEDGRSQVIILSRGGGAKEDLACFNDERVVRAIVACPIPMIAGIGHQRDESLADLAADVCAHTPTAAAVMAVPQLMDLEADHRLRVQRLRVALGEKLHQRQLALQALQARLQRHSPQGQLAQDCQRLATLRQRLHQAVRYRLGRESQRQQHLRDRLQSLDPHGVIRRGYALVRQQRAVVSETQPEERAPGAIVRQGNQVQPGDLITITLAQGTIVAQVTQVLPDRS